MPAPQIHLLLRDMWRLHAHIAREELGLLGQLLQLFEDGAALGQPERETGTGEFGVFPAVRRVPRSCDPSTCIAACSRDMYSSHGAARPPPEGARPTVTAAAETSASATCPGFNPLARTRKTGGSNPISPRYDPRDKYVSTSSPPGKTCETFTYPSRIM